MTKKEEAELYEQLSSLEAVKSYIKGVLIYSKVSKDKEAFNQFNDLVISFRNNLKTMSKKFLDDIEIELENCQLKLNLSKLTKTPKKGNKNDQ